LVYGPLGVRASARGPANPFLDGPARSERGNRERTGQLGSILEHATQVSALDTGDVAPTAHPVPMVNVFRPDDTRPCLDRDEVLAQAPAAEDGRFRVPRILGEAP
jgi:aspartyl-tRNA(Asn)/glutamyl-tRNA(Gln) amidotransferase subunit C